MLHQISHFVCHFCFLYPSFLTLWGQIPHTFIRLCSWSVWNFPLKLQSQQSHIQLSISPYRNFYIGILYQLFRDTSNMHLLHGLTCVFISLCSHHTDSEDGNEISSNYTDESEYEISPRSNPGTFHRHTPAHEPQVCNALSRRKEFSSDSQYGSFERDDNAPSSGSQHDDRTLHVDNPQDPGHHRQLKWSPYRRRKLPSLHFVRKANRRYASCPDIELSDLSDNYSLDRSYSSSQNSNHRAPRQHEPRHNSVDRRSRAALSIDREDRRYRSRSAASIGSRHPCSSDSDISPRAAARGTETQWVTVELHRPHSRQSRARSKASSRPSTARSQSRASSRPPSTHSGRHRSASDSSRRERNQNIVYIDEIQPRVHRKSHTRQHYDHNRVNSKHHMQHESRYRDRSRNNRSRSRTRSTSSTMTKQSTQRHYHQGFMKNTNAVRGYDPMSDTDTSTVASSHSPVNNTARTGYQNYGFVSDEYSPNSHSNC